MQSSVLTGSATRVAIIGGGISGLSTAWYLQQQARQTGIDVHYTVFEGANRWGGKILTERVDGIADMPFVVEAGPDSFLTQKPWGLQLARELGLEKRLLGTNDQMRNVYVLHKGNPTRLPDGVLLIVPTKFMPFALSPLISPLGKLRIGLDLLIPARKDSSDETLADFVRRRLGSEALDKIAEPLMAGIYNAEAERQSLLATFPRFHQLEQEHGSLIRGMLASRRKHEPANNGPAPLSMFVSLQNGIQELVNVLVTQLTGALKLGITVQCIEQVSDAAFRLTSSDGEISEFDTVIITTPAYVASQLVRLIAPQAADRLESIRYVSTGTISLAFREADVRHPIHGFGLVIPHSEQRPINAITVSSIKFNHRAPEGYVLLRVFFGGVRSPQTMTLEDHDLLRVVCHELRHILGIEAAPLFHRIYRWHHANPQYDLGHPERVDVIEKALPHGLYVTGSAYRGVGIPDCVYQAQRTAQKVLAHRKQQTFVT